MFKIMSKMSGNTGIRLKSIVIVSKTFKTFKAIVETDHSDKSSRLKNFSKSKQKLQSPQPDANIEKDKSADHEKPSRHKKIWPSIESLTRHAHIRPLGVTDDWGPLTHKHELMPMDNVRYWHQHRCELCDKLFEHKHKQRGDKSMDYNKHICNVCGGTAGSRRVSYKNSQPSIQYRKIW